MPGFHEILKLVNGWEHQMHELVFAGAISMPCGAHVYYSYMTRRAGLPRSNTGTGDVLATSSDVKFSTFLVHRVFELQCLNHRRFMEPDGAHKIKC